jgi:DNA primase
VSKGIDVQALLAALKIPVVNQKGSLLWCCCPMHGERTPSFYIRDEPGDPYHAGWHCYGCKLSGFPVQLVQKLLGFATQREGFEWLRTMPEVERALPTTIRVVSKPVMESPLRVPDAVRFDRWPERYTDYLSNRRVTLEQRERWGIGYVDRQSESDLADRVWIPARDAKGKLLSYTARAVGKSRRRYREPHKDEGAQDGAVFGELYWADAPGDVVLVCEGGFNCLAAERVTPRPLALAALFGSSLDTLQVLKLSRFPRVLLATDPDKAGEAAAQALSGALVRYTRVDKLTLPVGEDCDSLPPEDLRALLASALT